LFGATAAIHLARAGHEVHIFERSGELMSAASGINQYRLHQGHHYPRSPETVAECQAGLSSFLGEYGEAVINGGEQYYAIAKEGSNVSALQYAAFCMQAGLYLAPCRSEFVSRDAVESVFNVSEGRIDLHRLRTIIGWRLDDAGIMVHGRPADGSLRREFDRIVLAAYAATNDIAAELGAPVEPFQFEVVEKPVVRMPDQFRDVSIVILDGEFCCIDPFGRTGLHVIGHVTHAIHASNVGFWPEVPEHLAPYLNRGVVREPSGSRFREFIEAGRRFIPALGEAVYQGSMFTVRTVLPNRDATDERPTLVQALDEKVVRIFSGKLGCAVTAAEKVVSMLRVEKREAA
jgi:D-amino-acid oxidase